MLAAVLLVASPAGAAAPLSSVVLSDSLPGFVVSPPGPDNGPVTGSRISASGIAALAQHVLGGGSPTGYVRTWTRGTDSVGIGSIRYDDAGVLTDIVSGLNRAVSQTAVSTFDVPGVSGASGFVETGTSGGQSVTAYVVDFVQGNELFMVQVQTVSGDVGQADAVSLASRQAAQANGGTVLTDPWLLGPAAAVLLVLLVVVPVLIRRRERAPTAPPVGSPTTAGTVLAPTFSSAVATRVGDRDPVTVRPASGEPAPPPDVAAPSDHGSPQPVPDRAAPPALAGLPLLGARSVDAPTPHPSATSPSSHP